MPRLWLMLGAVSLAIGGAGYIYQDLVLQSLWNWSQVTTMETVVSMAMSVGIALFFVAAVEYKR